MQPEDIDHFFKVVSDHIDQPMRVGITGGTAANLFGTVRNTLDIDFEYQSELALDKVQHAINQAEQQTGIAAEFADDIDHWGMISLADYRQKLVPYKKIGHVDIYTLSVGHWSIGKLARYFEPDVQDLIQVFKKQNPTLDRLIEIWLNALSLSPKSPAQFEFKRHVVHFIQEHGKGIWGKTFDSETFLKGFKAPNPKTL